MSGSTSLCCGGAFTELKEQFHSGRTPGCQCGNLGCGPDHVFTIILIKTLENETLQYTPQLVKTVVKAIMKVESSKQIRSLACCSMTIDSKSHLVAPAVSTEYPVIQEEPVSKSEKQPEPWCSEKQKRIKVEKNQNAETNKPIQFPGIPQQVVAGRGFQCLQSCRRSLVAHS